MADTVVSFVINQLSTMLLQEGNLLGGLKQEVQHITDEFQQMRAFLQVAEARAEDNPMVQAWMQQVREAAYEIEDLLDEFTLLFARRHPKGCCCCFKRIFYRIKNFKAHHSIANEIQTINNRIRNISEVHQRYRIENGTSSHHAVAAAAAPMINSWWDDAVLEGKAKLVGIQEPRQQLISQLLQGGTGLKVISVVGMQGTGKTTLVKKVHEDAEVMNQFQIRAWVTASQSRSTLELLKDLIRQIYEQIKKPASKIAEGVNRLKSDIRELLQDKRYVIVFDDVCDMDFWNSIKLALPEGSYGSRVMLTTPIPDVAQGLESPQYVHKMKPLSIEDSWSLFCRRSFKADNCPKNLKHIAQDIMKKCEGLPLAIVTMAGLLASKDKNKIEEWEMVQSSIGGEEDGLGRLDMVKKMIHLNYKSLPSHLKTCLLYISTFPQGYEIQCHRLIQLWIAERFVQGQGEMTSEEVALDYLKELIRRSLIQVVQLSWDGSPNLCHIHDLVREMILRKSQEQNMMTIDTGQHTTEREKVFRLVINHSLHSTQESRKFKHLRSLITFATKESLERDALDELLSSKLLKVVDLRDAKLEEIPDGVFNLYHLKYLCLRGTRVKTIPRSIKKLQNLEHLHLGETNVIELPKEILKLRKLRHLRVFQVVDSSDIGYQCNGIKPPSKIGELISLHTLLFIDAQNDKRTIVGEIGELIHLRELGITKLRREDGEGLCSSLEKLTNLQELDIAAIQKEEVIGINFSLSPSSLPSLRELILKGKLERLPTWIDQLHSLMKIELTWSRLSKDADPLEPLQDLPKLVHICFTQAYEGEELKFKAEGFKKLEMLNLRNMDGLKRVVIENGSMPRLRQLYLSQLPSLEDLPLGIEHLKQAQSLHLMNINSAVTERLLNLGDSKIANIPQVLMAFWRNGEWTERRLNA